MKWFDIPIWKDHQITRSGRVRIIGEAAKRGRWKQGKELTNRKLADGGVARFLLATFKRPPKKGEMACHKNDIRQDNRLSNLYWGTHKENAQDAVRNGIISKDSQRAIKHKEDMKKYWSSFNKRSAYSKKMKENYKNGKMNIDYKARGAKARATKLARGLIKG